MPTPLEQDVLLAFKAAISERVSPAIVEGLATAFQAETLPTPDVIAQLIRESTGGRNA